MADVRHSAAILVASILKQQGSLSSLLPEASAKLDPRDRPLLQELCYGVCRWQPRLQCYLNHLLQKPLRSKDSDVQALLLLGLYQIIYMRVPDHAALNATVDAAQKLKKIWAKKLINGVLRNFIRQREDLELKLQSDQNFVSAHPAWMLKAFKKAWPSHYQDIVEQNNKPPPFTLRINQQQIEWDSYLTLLEQHDISAVKTPYSEVGITLEKALQVDQLPRFNSGAVSVQDEAPQFCAELLSCKPNDRVLDACAAPGGKTAHLLERYPAIEMLAIDISAKRLARVDENLKRLELKATLAEGDACDPNAWWDGNLFDRILIDAPCSATGIIRRQPDIKILRSPESIAKLVNTQRAMLNALWSLLKSGGELLYATCSILPEENVEQINQFIVENPDATPLTIEADWGIGQVVGRQCFPQANGHDGFYFARLTKQ